ncbi:MAG: hypothetical protein IH591_20490 [Bacteroidales bacterium]|nr:hypothetical protein [Bacteroidales bacterium]
MGILRKQKQFLKRVINRSPLHAWYSSGHDLASLRRKINLYFKFSPSIRMTFSDEIAFLNSDALLSNHWSFLFPYSFVFKYDHLSVKVHKDEADGLFYVIHNGRRLYYSRIYRTEEAVQHAYNGISIEQDERSPHCYTDDKFCVEQNDAVVDIGAAEGNFSLDVIEKARVIYIIEPDSDWIEALNATFRPWKDKVRIINKFAAENDSENCISLAGLLGDNPVNFIKMDVGGAEAAIIRSSEGLLTRNASVKLAVCTYHRKEDAKTTEKALTDLGFTWSYTNGYMLYVHTNLTPPYFRKTLLRAQKV